MKIVRLAQNRNRILALAAVTLLLHVAALYWVGRHLGAAGGEDEPRVIMAELRPAPVAEAPKPAPRPAASKPAAPKPAARPRRAPRPVQAPAPAMPEPEPALSAPALPEPAVPEPALSEPVLAAAVPDAVNAAAADIAAVAAPPPAQADEPPRVALPPPAQLILQVERTEPKSANPTYGVGRIGWEPNGNRYRVRVEADLDLLLTKLNLLKQTSEGRLGSAGLEPQQAIEARRGRSESATHFNRDGGAITFSASTRSVPLAAGAQDRASLLMQLAGLGRADPGQLDRPDGFPIQVAEARDAAEQRFFSLGFEEVDTRMGKLRAWHVARPPRPGAYSSRLDIWFAPSYEWYPVVVRATEANGAVTTQYVTKILIANAAPPP